MHAAVLIITRRQPALLPASLHDRYATFLREGFAHARLDSFVAASFGCRRLAGQDRPLGFDVSTGIRDVRLDQWLRLFEAFNSRR